MDMKGDRQSVEKLALVLARADVEYRGFDPLDQPPLEINSDWYYNNVEGWPWYCYLAEQVLKAFDSKDLA